jgi:hypothetical protein
LRYVLPRRYRQSAALWLFIINLGVAFGAGLYEHRIVMPDWITWDADGAHWNAGAARHGDTGLRFWALVSTGPLTLLTLTNLFAKGRGCRETVGNFNYLRHAIVFAAWLTALPGARAVSSTRVNAGSR